MSVGREEEPGRDDGDHLVDRHNPVDDPHIDDRPADDRQERPYPAWRRRLIARRDTKPASAVIAGGGERAVAAWILVGVGAIGLAIFAAWGSAAAPPMPPDESPPGAAYRPPWAGFVPLE
jgi:hypothetical protein